MPLYGKFVKISGDTMTGALINDAQIGVGVSIINPNYGLEVLKTFTDTSGEKRGLSFVVTASPASDSTANNFGFLGFAEHNTSSNLTSGQLSGGFLGARVSNTATMNSMFGIFSEVQSTAAGTVTLGIGSASSINDTGGADYTTAYGEWILCGITSPGTISTFHGVHISNPFGTGAVTNNHAIYVDDQSKGSTNRGLSFAGSGVNNSVEWSGDTNIYRAFTNSLGTDDGLWFAQDSSTIYFGAGFDFGIYHDGTNNNIDSYNGLLIIDSTSGSGTRMDGNIGFFATTPISQVTTAVAEATFTENAGGTAVNDDSTFGGYTIGQIVQALQNYGLLA